MRRVASLISLCLVFGFMPSAEAVKPRAGASCKTLGAKQISNNREFTCVKKGKKRVWNKGVALRIQPTSTSTPTPTLSATPAPTPTPLPSLTPSPTPTPTPTPTVTVTSTPTPSPTSTVRSFTAAEVATRNSETSCWSIVNGDVYDLTNWIRQHPGGKAAILRICGVDGTSRFTGQHGGSSSIAAELKNYYIGKLAGG
ncbi:MAG: hypothetical protein RLZZ527_843 [Actinomycetota bacterium]